MSNAPLLPHAAAWKDAQGRPLPVEFFRFLSDLQRFVRDVGGGAVGLEELAARVAALEEGEQTSIRGIGSVRVQDGVVQLLGDVDNPSGSQVYGSSPAGERGWWNIVDAFTVGAGLTKTTSDDGYNLLGELDDVSDLPGSASVDDAYLIDGDYWVWGGSDWTNVGPPSNTAEIAVYPGTNKDDGLLWNPSLPTPDFEVAPVVRNPMTTGGDLIYRGSGGAPARLGIGSNGDRLGVVSGAPAWVTPQYGNLVAGSNVTLTGTLTGRLVGTGNVTISATGGGGGDDFDIGELYDGGIDGVWYDPSNLSTLFQDSAGTTPVTADGQPVGLMLDLSGNGHHATQSTSGARPTYRTDGERHWLEAAGAQWMYVGAAAAETDWANFTSFLMLRTSGSSQSIFVKPHDVTHTSPYFRWSYWGSGYSWSCRWNGIETNCTGMGAAIDQIFRLDSYKDVQQSIGEYGSATASPGSFTAFTYPNSVRARLFSNASDGELFSGRFYGVVLVCDVIDYNTRKQLVETLLGKILV